MAQTDDFDIDLSAYFRAVGRLWWLVVLLAVVGALAGYAIARSGHKTYTSSSAVYLGQPTDANGNAIVGLSSNPRAAQQMVQGSDMIKAAVATLNGEVTVSQVRNGLSVSTPTVTAKTASAPTNFIVISVTTKSAAKSAAAANALAQQLVDRLKPYSTAKIALLTKEVADTQVQLAAADARLAAAQKQMVNAAKGGGTTNAIASSTALSVVQSATVQREALQTQLQNDKLSLLVAQQVESPRLISTAVPGGGTRPQVNLHVAGGALAGIVIALIIAAFTMRRRPAPEPAAAGSPGTPGTPAA